MEKCVNCLRTEEEVKLLDGLEVGRTVKICERCSLLGGMPVVKRPSTLQLKDSEKPYNVRERLSFIAHLQTGEKKEKSVTEQLREIDSKPELEKPSSEDELVFKLVDNFKWVIMTERRRKGITQKQLADTLGESVSAVMMLEKGIVPSKAINLIQGIEQLLKIRLIKRDFLDQIEEQKKQLVESEKIIEKRKIDSDFSERKSSASFKVEELQRQNDRIENDFAFGRKTREQVGNEQTENTGSEDLAHLKKTVMKDSFKQKNTAPTIYELMKHKEERDRQILGKDIDLE